MNDIEEEDVICFDYGGKIYIIVCDYENNYFCSDGLCIYEDVYLFDGLVVEVMIECFKYVLIFDVSNGEVEILLVCENLWIYLIKVEDGCVFVVV